MSKRDVISETMSDLDKEAFRLGGKRDSLSETMEKQMKICGRNTRSHIIMHFSIGKKSRGSFCLCKGDPENPPEIRTLAMSMSMLLRILKIWRNAMSS